MKIIVTGGGGFLGSKVTRELLAAKDEGRSVLDFDSIVSLDLVESPVRDQRVISEVGDIASEEFLHHHIDDQVVGIFHLAAVLSGGSEDDFDLAYKVNVEATRLVLEAARRQGKCPRIVFTSSLAVFGTGLPPVVTDSTAVQPESTYGAVKAIGELLVNEYSRKGYVDGRVCRVPTISVRPGKPNSAASSFASGIIREPLNGVRSIVPVPIDTQMWLSSPDTAVENLVRVFELTPQQLPVWRVINLPGITVTVQEMMQALERAGGSKAIELLDIEYDARVADIVLTWPRSFDLSAAESMGLIRDRNFDAMVDQYCQEFLG